MTTKAFTKTAAEIALEQECVKLAADLRERLGPDAEFFVLVFRPQPAFLTFNTSCPGEEMRVILRELAKVLPDSGAGSLVGPAAEEVELH